MPHKKIWQPFWANCRLVLFSEVRSSSLNTALTKIEPQSHLIKMKCIKIVSFCVGSFLAIVVWSLLLWCYVHWIKMDYFHANSEYWPPLCLTNRMKSFIHSLIHNVVKKHAQIRLEKFCPRVQKLNKEILAIYSVDEILSPWIGLPKKFVFFLFFS